MPDRQTMPHRTTKDAEADKQTYTFCNKCEGELFRSKFRHLGEMLISPLLLPFRCSRCGWRQFRSVFSRVRDRSNFDHKGR